MHRAHIRAHRPRNNLQVQRQLVDVFDLDFVGLDYHRVALLRVNFTFELLHQRIEFFIGDLPPVVVTVAFVVAGMQDRLRLK